MQQLSDILTSIDPYIGSSLWFVLSLLGGGLFFTIYLGLPQFKYFGHALRILRGNFDHPGAKVDTSHFGALFIALSGARA